MPAKVELLQIFDRINQEHDIQRLQILRNMFLQEYVICDTLVELQKAPDNEELQDHLVELNFAPLDYMTVAQLRQTISASTPDQQAVFQSWLFEGLGGFKFKDKIIEGIKNQVDDPETRFNEAAQLINAVDVRIGEVSQTNGNAGISSGVQQ